MYTISCYIRQRYNGTVVRFGNCVVNVLSAQRTLDTINITYERVKIQKIQKTFLYQCRVHCILNKNYQQIINSASFQAEEVSQNRRYTTARVKVQVTSVNEFAPVISSSVGDFTGYIYENSPRNTFVSHDVDAEALQLIVHDPDWVSHDLLLQCSDPANTQCKKHVIITSKRRFGIIITGLLRFVFAVEAWTMIVV